MKRDTILNASTIVLTVCAVILTVAAVSRLRRDQSAPLPSPRRDRTSSHVASWKQLASRGQWAGPLSAPVVIVEFADYQCPACRELQSALIDVAGSHPLDVAVVYRHFPLTRIHPHAYMAAAAAECAASQGRFQQFHTLAFKLQDSIGMLDWPAFARRAGVENAGAFATCMATTAYQSRLDEDIEAGKRLGIAGTPTLLVNDLLVEGAPSGGELAKLVQRALQERQHPQ